MDTESFIVYIKTEHIYLDIAKDCEIRFDTSNYELDRPLPKGKNRKIIGLAQYELREEIMKEFAALKTKTYSYLTNNNDEDKKSKDLQNCVMTKKIKFEDYKYCLEATQFEKKNEPFKEIILI